ncbi:MAG: hypothetical protein ABSB49_18660 [Polyangia bacterium]
MVSPGFEADDPQDHGERRVECGTGDGAEDPGLRVTFGEALASEGETGGAEHGQENSDNGREDALLQFKLRDGIDQLLAVQLQGLHGDDRTRTTAPPSGNGGARDPDVLGQATGA